MGSACFFVEEEEKEGEGKSATNTRKKERKKIELVEELYFS